jgi:carboxylesterase type B
LVPDSPYILIRDGKVSKIPYITGNNKDEATLFIPRNMGGLLFGTKLYDWMLKAYPGFIARSVYNKIVAVYPNIPSLGWRVQHSLIPD